LSDVVYRRDDCRLCHSTELEVALSLTPTPPADAYVPPSRADEPQPVFPIDLYLCRECGFVQLLDVVRPEAIYGDYLYETSSSLGLVEHFDGYAQEVLDRIRPPAGSLVIDVGSNDGSLLRSFGARGMSVLGIDPAAEIARRATESGVETLPEFLTAELAKRIRAERGPASVVTANNVIANIDDLDEVARAIRELLAPDGVFVFESFYLGDLVRNMVFDFFYHEHLSAFAVGPLELFFPRHGLELIDVLRVPTKGGSLRYTVQLAGGPRSSSDAVRELKEEEEQQGLAGPELYRDFAARIDRAKTQVLDLALRLKREGHTIAGYGASATTTTLVYHFELGDLVEYIFDDYPAKQGLLSPGLHLPVVPSEEIYERRPDEVIVFAWRYHEPIARAHARFLEGGGRFIVPMPELRVL
jgi:SAM-dependent methyltransferase